MAAAKSPKLVTYKVGGIFLHSFRQSLKTFLFATYWRIKSIRGFTTMQIKIIQIDFLLTYLLYLLIGPHKCTMSVETGIYDIIASYNRQADLLLHGQIQFDHMTMRLKDLTATCIQKISTSTLFYTSS